LKKYLLILLISQAACNNAADKKQVVPVLPSMAKIIIPDTIVKSTDTSLQLRNGEWFYRQQPFSGTIKTNFSSGHLKGRQSFYKGKEEGVAITYYENGKTDAIRYYHLGEKDSVHRGWWNNGQLRFEYHFKMGVYDGDFKEWYPTGKPLKYIVYSNGKEEHGKGWRANGKIYMNFVMRDGRLYGSINPNLCYSLKNEKGEYINSLK
jgi:antitoxin component YwqK of YwqJK toxin-antitoxin module